MAAPINQNVFENYSNRSKGLLPLLFIPKCPKIIDIGPNCETMLVDVSMNINEYGVDLNDYRKGKCLYSGLILFREGDLSCGDSTCRCSNTAVTTQGTATNEIHENVNPDSLPKLLVTSEDPLISDLIFEDKNAFVTYSVMEQEQIKPEITETVINSQETVFTYENEEESESGEYAGFPFMYEDYVNDDASVNVTTDEHSIEEQSSDNAALKQLLSKDIQSAKKQQKTILLEKSGQTVHKVKKPSSDTAENTCKNDVICEETNGVDSSFEINTQDTYKEETTYAIKADSAGRLNFICKRCGKKLKSKEKFEQHNLAHGNPNLECYQCHKVYASKYSLRNHLKIHSRKYKCDQCTKSFSDRKSFIKHIAKLHSQHVCRHCSFRADSITELKDHVKTDHWYLYDRPGALADDDPSLLPSMDSNEEVSNNNNDEEENDTSEEAVSHDSVIAKAISDGVFQTRRKKYYRDKICTKGLVKDGLTRPLVRRHTGSPFDANLSSMFEGVSRKNKTCNKSNRKVTSLKVNESKSNKARNLRKNKNADDPGGQMSYTCNECGKKLKTKEKLDKHTSSHGDPNLECHLCHKVYSTKYYLRNHLKIHSRKKCSNVANSVSELQAHIKSGHRDLGNRPETLTDYNPGLITPSDSQEVVVNQNNEKCNSIADEHNSIIAKAISNIAFQRNNKKYERPKKCNKKCEVCQKVFDRAGDLKRHLIEHIVKSTLAKTPVGDDGTLQLLCAVCRSQVFDKVDKYKAHLREHAHITLYKCSFCHKSFSDSSNFSKHKKVHGNYVQCELCKRKFNSKKMVLQHLKYHESNKPKHCEYCNKIYYFESTLKKHIKNMHTKQPYYKYKCRFCTKMYKSLKEKWDHEWVEHKVRKSKIDCTICGAQYRKYASLKKHGNDVHNLKTPPAK